jgi:tetratricopeptide (TPR) repeat protein
MKHDRSVASAAVAGLFSVLAGLAQQPVPAPAQSPNQALNQDDLRQGLAALSRNDIADAREFLERAEKLDPQSPVISIALAQTYLKSGQKEMAVQAAGRAAKLGANTPPIQHALALFYSGIGDFAKAAEWERRFAATPGADARTAANAAALSLDAGQTEEAVKWAEAAVRADDTPEAHHLLGQAYRAARQFQSALPELRRAFERNPEQEVFLSDFAQALLDHGDFAEALAILEKGQRQFPKNPQIVLAYGVACYAQRRPADAVGAFLQVIRLDDSIEQPYSFLSRILDHAGARLPEVIASYAAWEKKAPDNYLPVFLHAKALLATANPDAAEIETRLRRSIELNGAFWESHLELSELLTKQGKWPDAERELSRSIELNPRQARAHYDLARVYLKLGKPELAQVERAEYERLKNAENAAGLP